MQVAEPDARKIEVLEQSGDAGALALRVVGVNDFAAIGREREPMRAERVRQGIEPSAPSTCSRWRAPGAR